MEEHTHSKHTMALLVGEIGKSSDRRKMYYVSWKLTTTQTHNPDPQPRIYDTGLAEPRYTSRNLQCNQTTSIAPKSVQSS